MLASSFAACLLKNLARTRDLLGFEYAEADVEVVARRQDSPPRFVEITYSLKIVTDEPARRVDLVHQNLRKFGTIYNTLAAVCEVHGTVEARVTTASPRDGTGQLSGTVARARARRLSTLVGSSAVRAMTACRALCRATRSSWVRS